MHIDCFHRNFQTGCTSSNHAALFSKLSLFISEVRIGGWTEYEKNRLLTFPNRIYEIRK